MAKTKQPQPRFLNRTKATLRLSDVLSETDVISNTKSAQLLQHFIANWAKIVGPLVARHTRPITIRERCLLVRSEQTLIKDRKEELSAHLLKRVEGYSISAIELSRWQRESRPSEQKPIIQKHVEERTKDIKDEALRRAMAELIASFDAQNGNGA